MARTLMWFQKHTANDHVTVNVQKVYPDGEIVGKDETISDAALTARAFADGRATWDESDICALCDCAMPSEAA